MYKRTYALEFSNRFQVMKLGDPDVSLYGQPLPDGKTGISFTCPSSCTEENFEVLIMYLPMVLCPPEIPYPPNQFPTPEISPSIHTTS